MDYFSNSKPNLIAPAIQSTIKKVIKKGGDKKTISEKISNNAVDLYNKYISKHKFYIIIIACVIAFLVYRYYKNKKKENKKNDEKNIIIDNEHEENYNFPELEEKIEQPDIRPTKIEPQDDSLELETNYHDDTGLYGSLITQN